MTTAGKLISAILIFALSAGPGGGAGKDADIRGDLVIFHAGSLAVPFKQICRAFHKLHPRVKIIREVAGSRICARKIADLNKPCDVMASADYTVIDTLLIPEHATWNIKFAGNEMAIAFTKRSRRAGQINKDNWYKILLAKDVAFGRSDPNADPCGYRTVLTIKLAERFYNQPGLAEKMLKKSLGFIRPKEVDLLALLEVGQIDYIFIYRSIAQQHGLKYVVLADQINLKDPGYDEFYKTASVKITGKKPGTLITKRGTPMIYGVTIPKTARNVRAAMALVQFLLEKDKGLAILARNGQASVVPAPTDTFDKLPAALKKFARKKTNRRLTQIDADNSRNGKDVTR